MAQPSAFERFLRNPDLLVRVMVELPLSDAYASLRTNREWFLAIYLNHDLRRLLFVDPVPKEDQPVAKWHQLFVDTRHRTGTIVELCRRRFRVNPILDRSWLLGNPFDKRKYRDPFMTLTIDDTGRDSTTTFFKLPVEDVLRANRNPIDMKPPHSAEKWPLVMNSGWLERPEGINTQPYGQLDGFAERPFAENRQIYHIPGEMIFECHADGTHVQPTESWKCMLLTQPPVSVIGLKHPTMPVIWKLQIGEPVRIFHIIEALRKMLGSMPPQLCASHLHKAGNEIQIMIPLKGAGDKTPRNHLGSVWRSLEAKLKIELAIENVGLELQT